MRNLPALPVHPTKRHPLTGEPLQAVYVRADGRVFWPMIGAAEDGEGDGDDDAGDTGDGDGGDTGNLGFPADTPVADMTDEQKAAYNRHQREKNREQTRKWKSVTGDRTPEQLQADLRELEELRKSTLTDGERAVEDAKSEGRKEGVTLGNRNAVKAIFEAALDDEHSDDDVADLISALNVDSFINEQGEIDTKRLKSFAKKFVPAGKAADAQRLRDFGGGLRGGGSTRPGSVAQVMADRAAARESKNTNSTS